MFGLMFWVNMFHPTNYPTYKLYMFIQYNVPVQLTPYSLTTTNYNDNVYPLILVWLMSSWNEQVLIGFD